MSWFGGGKKDEPAEKSFDMGEASHMSDAMPVGGGGAGGLAEIQQFGAQSELLLLLLLDVSFAHAYFFFLTCFLPFIPSFISPPRQRPVQQQILIQAAITDMTDRAFIKCVTSTIKDGHLTGKEVACIQSSTNKWLDTNELLMGRLARKSQQQAQQQGFH